MKNLSVLFQDTVRRFPNKPALCFKQGRAYRSISWSELNNRVQSLAGFLLTQGLEAGDKVAILSENRPEWAMMDLAAQTVGLVTVPIYPSLTSQEIEYILNDSNAVLVAVSGKALLENIIPIQKNVPSLKFIIAFDASVAAARDELNRPIFLMKDLQKEPSPMEALEKRLGAIHSDAVASLIYTSGTTGNPKGVMLTHANFIHNVALSRQALQMGPSDIHLSFLPLSHVFERMAGYYLMIYIGATIAYAESMDTVAQNLLEVRPTFILGVPRFYEKIQQRVLEAVKQGGPVKKALFFWAKDIGEKKRALAAKKTTGGLLFKMEKTLARILVYKKFQKRLGGRVRFCVSGGAPLAKEVAEFFCDLGVLIYEGYGLTETSPVISVNRENKVKFGTVGIPLEGIQVKIAEDGEIATNSPSVMKGYFNKPEETRSVLRDGWFYTGDLGKIDSEGFLSITGRKKELIVTSGGKKVAPRAIEEHLEKDPYILRCVLYGEGRRYITALIVPREDKLREYAATEKMAYRDYGDLVRDEKIYQFIESRLEPLCAHLANFEKIKYFFLLDHDFTQGAGELTPTLKVKREVVFSRYKEELSRLYENEKVTPL